MDKLNKIEEGHCLLELVHHKQKFHWDCGIACILMILPDHDKQTFVIDFNNICKEEGFNDSTWTIDLCYLLKRFSIEHTYCTILKGVQPNYIKQPFYSKVISKDEERVTERFLKAPQVGLKVKECSLSLEDFIKHLSTNGPIILLTDANKLSCESCKFYLFQSVFICCTNTFQGHYVVLCGYDNIRKIFYYRNPTFRNRLCLISYNSLENARTSFGTDEDAILIHAPHILKKFD